MLSIPPKYSVANAVGLLKGKSAVRIHRELMKHRRMTGLHFWSAGYCVSTIGLNGETIRRYVREQDRRDGNIDDQQEAPFEQHLTAPTGLSPRFRPLRMGLFNATPYGRGG